MPRLHLLVSERELEGADAAARIERVVAEAGPIALHLRVRWTAERTLRWACRMTDAANRSGSWCVVNGRPDIALAAGAHAVQLGRTALRVEDARAVVAASPGRLEIGASVHDPDEAARAAEAGADYLVLGTIYPTPSHPGRAGSGPGAIAAAKRRLGREAPIFAIGGIGAERVSDVVAAGAHGIVVASAVWNEDDPAAAAAELQRRLEAAVRKKQDG